MSFSEIFIHIALFLALYFQVFTLLTHFIWAKEKEGVLVNDSELPTVSIMVPCWNEETTVEGTVKSLLAMDYPKDKLKVLVINDGSTDSTWQVLQQFKGNSQVVLLQKENEGSKFAALNYGLTFVDTEIVGCLDADSHVDIQALRHSVSFFNDPEVMSVVPSMIIDRPKTFWQVMQKPEYEIALFLRKIQSSLDAIYVTPGPFTIFRKSVFDTLGPYKEAYHTEDLEIALRMQMNHMKIVYSENTIVYTKGPASWIALLKQRIRWTYGFIKNITSKEYLPLIFSRKHGNLSQVILPFAVISIILVVIGFPLMIYSLLKGGVTSFSNWADTGFLITMPSFDLFFVTLRTHFIITLILLSCSLYILYIIRRNTIKVKVLSWDVFSLLVYPFFASWWTIRSVYNAIRSQQQTWR